MNEIYKLLQNVQEIAKANNLFLQAVEKRLQNIEAMLSIDKEPEPTAVGAEKDKNKAKEE